MATHNVKDMAHLPPSVLAAKCCTDAQATYLLADYFPTKGLSMEYYERERHIIPMLEFISQRGIRLDQERRAELDELYSRDYAYYLTQARGFGFEPSAPRQVGYALASRGNFLPMTRGKTQLATDDVTLKKCKDPLAALVLNFRHVQKMLTTYIRPLAGQERAYTTLHLDAITGRVSSGGAGRSDPDRNLQNIPKKVERGNMPTVRSMFLPDDGDNVWTRIDAVQIELRVLAYLSQDQRMLSIFESGGDLHQATSEALHITRDYAKIFNFALIYLGDDYTLANNIGTSDLAAVRRMRAFWADSFPQAARWVTVQQLEGLRNGYVETLYGRRMPLPLDMGEKHARSCSVDYPIQGTAAEVFKIYLLALLEFLPSMRLLVHDEDLMSGRLEMPKGLEDLTPVRVPMKVEHIERWG